MSDVISLILGLDVSPKRLGWGLVDLVTGKPIAAGMESIDLPSHGWAHQQVAHALDQVCHHNRLWCDTEVQAVYVEQPALPPVSGTKSAYSAGRAVQAAHGECERRWPWAPIEYLMPSEWRKLAGLAGNASKADVYTRAAGLVGEEVLSRGQDAADALLIAVAGWHRNEDVVARAAAIANGSGPAAPSTPRARTTLTRRTAT